MVLIPVYLVSVTIPGIHANTKALIQVSVILMPGVEFYAYS